MSHFVFLVALKPRQSKNYLFFIVAIFFFLRSALPVSAESSIECHCLRARTYNPADKFAADDYILAASFNSLLAKAFNIFPRKIIMIKMNEGESQEELLLSLKLSKITEADPQQVFQAAGELILTFPGGRKAE